MPIGGGLGRLFLIGEQPIDAQVQAFFNVEHPELGANWTSHLQIQLLF